MRRRPSTELIEWPKALDSDFFGREFPPNSGKSLAEGVFVLPGLANKRILPMANRVIVPEAAVSRMGRPTGSAGYRAAGIPQHGEPKERLDQLNFWISLQSIQTEARPRHLQLLRPNRRASSAKACRSSWVRSIFSRLSDVPPKVTRI
jgi:hypothetical protein